MTGVKRWPRCGHIKAAEQFYRRRGGRRLSPYCQLCSGAASREAGSRRQNPAAAEDLRAVDRARQRRRPALGGQDGEHR